MGCDYAKLMYEAFDIDLDQPFPYFEVDADGKQQNALLELRDKLKADEIAK